MTRSAALVIVAGLILFPAFAQTNGAGPPYLKTEKSHKIFDQLQGFSEPSGLALASDGQGYWSVSDDSPGVFRLDPEGTLLPDLAVPLGVVGLEGVVEDVARDRLLLVREDDSTIISVGLTDGEVSFYSLADMSGFDRIAKVFGPIQSNKGLEGITVNTTADEVVVVKENQPRLMIRVSADLSTVLEAVELTGFDGFACMGTLDDELDVSDIAYDDERKAYWLLSDEGACILRLDPETGTVSEVRVVNSSGHPKRHLKNSEGIALNQDGTELRVVTDDGKDSRLFIMSIQEP